MLELKVANRDITSGSIAVAWCVDEETIKLLSEENVLEPQVVIVVVPTANYHPRREYRKVVPLQDLMTYLEFRSSGENQIWAFISPKDKKAVRNEFLTKESGQYKTDILDIDGKEWGLNFAGKYVTAADGVTQDYVRSPKFPAEPVTVNVPTGVFAKEPAKWEKIWVNHWFRDKAIDQCDYRRRRLLAYTLQPIVMLLDVLVYRLLLAIIAVSYLSRGLCLKYFLHPLTYSVWDAADLLKGGTWAIAHLPEDEGSDLEITFSYVVRKLWKLPLMPVSLLLLWFMVHFHLILALLIAVLLFLLVSFLAFAITGGAIGDIMDSFWKWWDNKQHPARPWYLDQEELEAITCNPSFQDRTSVSALPAKHRTISLRFQDLKSRVCRPFSA